MSNNQLPPWMVVKGSQPVPAQAPRPPGMSMPMPGRMPPQKPIKPKKLPSQKKKMLLRLLVTIFVVFALATIFSGVYFYLTYVR